MGLIEPGGGHILTAVSGFRLRIIPSRVPYRYRLGPSPAEVDVEILEGDAWLGARIIASDGGFQSTLRSTTPTLADVADVTAGPELTSWWLETSAYRVPLIAGWTALSGDGPSAFDLIGPGDCLVFVQTPKRIPPLTEMRGPGQQIGGSGSDARSEWVDLSYIMDDVRWNQRHHVVRAGAVVAVITAQAPESRMSSAIAVQMRWVEEIVAA